MPFGFHLAMDTLPSGDRKWWLQVRLGCIRLSSSCPFRRLHTFHFSGQRGFQPRFWIQCSSSEHRRDFNPPDQRAAQRTPWFYLRLAPWRGTMALLGCPREHMVARETDPPIPPRILTLEPVRAASPTFERSGYPSGLGGGARLCCLWHQMLGCERLSSET